MKITKFVHSCLLVEMPAPVNRTVLFDPGVMSESALDVDKLEFLDDVVITHIHSDHVSTDLVKRLVAKFPNVRITTTPEVVDMLAKEGIAASAEAPEGITFFESPHADLRPWGQAPQEIGVHYLGALSHPGDSHDFHESKEILAMPMTAPWGSMIKAVNVALELKPKHVIPIHDWHWKDEALDQMYSNLEGVFTSQGITLHRPKTGEPFVIDVAAA